MGGSCNEIVSILKAKGPSFQQKMAQAVHGCFLKEGQNILAPQRAINLYILIGNLCKCNILSLHAASPYFYYLLQSKTAWFFCNILHKGISAPIKSCYVSECVSFLEEFRIYVSAKQEWATLFDVNLLNACRYLLANSANNSNIIAMIGELVKADLVSGIAVFYDFLKSKLSNDESSILIGFELLKFASANLTESEINSLIQLLLSRCYSGKSMVFAVKQKKKYRQHFRCVRAESLVMTGAPGLVKRKYSQSLHI